MEHIEVAKGISDYGMMAMTCAFFLLLSGSLMIACFKWFKSIINKIMANNTSTLSELLKETKEQNEKLDEISEGLRSETLLRIKTISGAFFDLSVEKVCRIIKKVREENHVIDHEKTLIKIRTLVGNLHADRDSKFDCFSYKGKKLSSYTSVGWVDWVVQVIESEIYNESGVNNGRAYTNVKAVYDRIKIEFYNNLNV